MRTFEFAVRIVRMAEYLEGHRLISASIRSQVLRSGTSIGANLEEALAGESRKDFIHKNSIALKEARETSYWLRIIIRTVNCDDNVLSNLTEIECEAVEIMKILGKIVSKSKRTG